MELSKLFGYLVEAGLFNLGRLVAMELLVIVIYNPEFFLLLSQKQKNKFSESLLHLENDFKSDYRANDHSTELKKTV